MSSVPSFSLFLPPNTSCGIQALGFQEGLVNTDLTDAVIPQPPNCEEQQANISISCSFLLSFSANSETNVETMGCFSATTPSLNTISAWAAVSASEVLVVTSSNDQATSAADGPSMVSSQRLKYVF